MVSVDDVVQVFKAGGPLARAFPGYAPRRAQIAMAERVARALDGGETLFAEAGTGTGKSFAYLVAALAFSADRRARGEDLHRVLVLTSGLPLMGQIMSKDAPTVARALGQPAFAVQAVKGMGNYLCMSRLANVTIPDSADLRAVRKWADATTAGDLAELPFEPSGKLRGAITVSPGNCRGPDCRQYNACWAFQARRAAAAAPVVVTNYHLLLSAVAGPALPRFLNGFAAVICDEAHELADIARTALGFDVNLRAVRAAARFADVGLRGEAARAGEDLFRRLGAMAGTTRRLTRDGSVGAGPLVDVLRACAASTKDAIKNTADPELRKDQANAVDSLAQVVADLTAADELEAGRVYYLEPVGESASLKAAIPRPGSILRDRVWSMFPARVFTSATLSTTGKHPFAFVSRELGVKDAAEFVAPSPFNYREQLRLYVALDLKGPERGRSAEFHREVAGRVVELVRAARGRALCLFTSFAALRVTQAAMRAAGIVCRAQGGEHNRDALIGWLREDPRAVVLGVNSMGTGVDVPGLSLVTIDRLPLSRPDDPVMDAIRDDYAARGREGACFGAEVIPRGITQFRQWVGRAIRGPDDRVLVAVLDPRIRTKGYGIQFQRALPPAVLGTERLDRALEWFTK